MGGLHLYMYCWNKPVKYTDPTGHYSFMDDGNDDTPNNQGNYGSWDNDGSGSDGSGNSLLPCPTTPPVNDPNWKPYNGSEEWFHCGYIGYVQKRDPTPDNPAGECVYDEHNQIVDEKHRYDGCQGTANDYPSDDYINHTLFDKGGPSVHGLEGFTESRRKDFDDLKRDLDGWLDDTLNEAYSRMPGPGYGPGRY